MRGLKRCLLSGVVVLLDYGLVFNGAALSYAQTQDAFSLRALEWPVIEVEVLPQGPEGAVEAIVILQAAPFGLKRYDLAVTVSDPEVASIAAVEGVLLKGFLFQVVSQDGAQVRFRALDLEDRVQETSQGQILARLSLIPKKPGMAFITLSVLSFVDDRDAEVAPLVLDNVPIIIESLTGPGSGEIAPGPVSAFTSPPRDLDQDGLYEDIDGDGAFGLDDVYLLLRALSGLQTGAEKAFFDFNRDGSLTSEDVSALLSLATVFHMGSSEVDSGQRAMADLVLLQAPRGVRSFEITIRLTTPGNIRLVGIQGNAIATQAFQVVYRTDAVVRLKAVDLFDVLQPSASGVLIAKIEFQSHSKASSGIELTVHDVTGDDGASVPSLTLSGYVRFLHGPDALQNDTGAPQDLDGDGLYEDVNGDGVFDLQDPTLLGFNLENPVVLRGVTFFDFNGDGQLSFEDVVALAKLQTR